MKLLVPLALAAGFVPAAALAQTGAPLLLDPWERYGPERSIEAHVELAASGLFFRDADIDDADDDLDLNQYESRGRIKLTDEPGAGPALGYQAMHLDLNTADPALPERLSDTSVAAAYGWRLDDDWELGLVAGAGYAGTTPYSDGDSLYFLADLILARRLDERSKLTFNLNFNGNRNLWPDAPLPAVSYARTSESIDGLTFIVGFPFTRVIYRPDDRWTLTASYAVPYTIEARVGYRVSEPLELFAAYDSFTRGFWMEDAPGHGERIFFTQRRAEAGVVWAAAEQIDLTLAAGYAFDQEFETGWDTRDTDTLRDIDPAPYLRAAVELAW